MPPISTRELSDEQVRRVVEYLEILTRDSQRDQAVDPGAVKGIKLPDLVSAAQLVGLFPELLFSRGLNGIPGLSIPRLDRHRHPLRSHLLQPQEDQREHRVRRPERRRQTGERQHARLLRTTGRTWQWFELWLSSFAAGNANRHGVVARRQAWLRSYTW